MTTAATLPEVLHEVDLIIARLERAKHYRGGSLNHELGTTGSWLLDLAAAVRANYPAFD